MFILIQSLNTLILYFKNQQYTTLYVVFLSTSCGDASITISSRRASDGLRMKKKIPSVKE